MADDGVGTPDLAGHLPDDKEEIDPAFEHRGAASLPVFSGDGVSGRLIMGRLEGLTAPVTLHADTLYADLGWPPAPATRSMTWPRNGQSISCRAAWTLPARALTPSAFWCSAARQVDAGRRPRGSATSCCYGGAAFASPRHIWWNFVSSSRNGSNRPRKNGDRPLRHRAGDETVFIPCRSLRRAALPRAAAFNKLGIACLKLHRMHGKAPAGRLAALCHRRAEDLTPRRRMITRPTTRGSLQKGTIPWTDMPATPLLDQVKLPADLRAIDDRDLPQLAEELRAEMIDAVSRTGGHLGAGLGVIELTIAIHKVFEHAA